MLVCFFSCTFAHETAGAARTRSSLRPLISDGVKFTENLAQIMRRDREAVFANKMSIATHSSCPDRSAKRVFAPGVTGIHVFLLPAPIRQLDQIAAGGRRRGAVLPKRLDDVAADLPFVHLVGAVDQPLRADLGVPLGENRI